jgi:hypothetical protein
MKATLIAALVLASMLSCSKDDDGDPAPDNQIGCITGIPKSGGDRELIKCATQKQFSYGTNPNGGVVSKEQWEAYTSHKWELCDSCK